MQRPLVWWIASWSVPLTERGALRSVIASCFVRSTNMVYRDFGIFAARQRLTISFLQILHRRSLFSISIMMPERYYLLWLLIWSTHSLILAQDLQPEVITVEEAPAVRAMASISLPLGSPWCDGKPTYWLVGHQADNESPQCLVTNDDTTTDFANYNYTGSQWLPSSVAVLDLQDELNADDGRYSVDRHGCSLMDVNNDDVPDVLCGVGANRGTGFGYNEVYLTETGNSTLHEMGSLVKVLQGHGLHRFPTMRNRKMATLKGANGESLVFLTTDGNHRADGEPNQHRMFRLDDGGEHGFIFRHVPGPWTQYSSAHCLEVVDVNQDGLDDLLICNDNKAVFIFLQETDGGWSRLPIWGQRAKGWRNARVADVNGDGFNDLVVVGSFGPSQLSESHYVRVFQGLGVHPFFDLYDPAELLYEQMLPHRAPDVEILDANADGKADLYVVQFDWATRGSYCNPHYEKTWGRGPYPPAWFVPPVDLASDFLLVGTGSGDFTPVVMDHAEPGCGSLVKQFGGNRTLILAQGSQGRAGHNLLLQW